MTMASGAVRARLLLRRHLPANHERRLRRLLIKCPTWTGRIGGAGDYRIVYTVSDREVVVEIIKIGHRREVYRD